MKRRNAEIGKMRRPMKRNKITEGFYGSTLLYLKFLVLWVLVILADFILEFRFEFLWPFYLLLRSVYDSFRYQGLAFSVLFVCVALTSDMLCYFFIPVHWLFFAASTYVWVQYVWHTDRGVCAPTVVLWILFVYLEAAVRLRDVKHMPGHLDLCRPFAAHCIGYPVVTLGFGFKSYIGFRMRQRRQKDVAKENEFYMQLMQHALPVDTTPAATNGIAAAASKQSSSAETAVVPVSSSTVVSHTSGKLHVTVKSTSPSTVGSHHEKNGHIPNGVITNGVAHHHSSKMGRKAITDRCRENDPHEAQPAVTPARPKGQSQEPRHSNGAAVGAGAGEETGGGGGCDQETRPGRRRGKAGSETPNPDRERDEYVQRMESDVRRLRADLQSCRTSEQELRIQVANLTTSEKVSKGELCNMQRELEELQASLQSAMSSRSSDRQSIGSLERRVAEERRLRCNVESQLSQERKQRKQEEQRAREAQQQAVAAAAAAAQSSRSGECTEQCRQRRRELEQELQDMRTSKHWLEERCTAVERESAQLAEQIRDTEILMSALSAMQDKNTHLENSLSAETRIKLDLFSALGEAKRQLEIRDTTIRNQEKEIEELKSKIAQVLAVMPTPESFNGPSSSMSRVRLTAAAENPPGSTLDPNATAYTPKGSLVTSTEA